MAAFAARYARAFAEVAAAQSLDAGAMQQQLRDFADAFAESKDLREVMSDPAIPHEQKLRVLDALAGRLSLSRQVRNFVAVLMDHSRLAAIADVVEAYGAVVDQQQGIVEAEVVTAHSLGEDERRSLEQKIAGMAGSKIRASYREDADLLGGAVIRIGSTVYDGSVRGQLETLRLELVGQ
ncbi:MAG: ATP synthase F1 subunit delta [Acidobacteriaceae bacterium]